MRIHTCTRQLLRSHAFSSSASAERKDIASKHNGYVLQQVVQLLLFYTKITSETILEGQKSQNFLGEVGQTLRPRSGFMLSSTQHGISMPTAVQPDHFNSDGCGPAHAHNYIHTIPVSTLERLPYHLGLGRKLLKSPA